MKHKNGQIRNLHNRWYVSFGNGYYLKKDGEVLPWKNNVHDSKTYPLITHETMEQAQATLDKYNKSEPTLSEIKEKLSAAKELIGKKIKILKGHKKGQIGEIVSVYLELDKANVKGLALDSMEKNGYCIVLKTQKLRCPYSDDVFEVLPSISVKNHSGEEYFAEQRASYWQFGCARISKQMIKDCLNLLNTSYADGNRKAVKVTIGAADFDFDTLKKLVDADNNKA